METVSLTYAIADQDFTRTKSIGILNVSLQLLIHLAHRREVSRLHVLGNSSLESSVPSLPHVTFERYDAASRGGIGRLLWDQTGVYEAAARTRTDFLLLPKGFASFVRKPPMRLVTYVHDTMLQYYASRYPSAFPRLERKYFDACLRATVRDSSVILTNSEFTATELRRTVGRWGYPPQRVLPVGIGIESPGSPPRPKSGRILVLLSRFPHKRTATAIEYMMRWASATSWSVGVDFVGSVPEGVTLPQRPGWTLHSRLGEAAYASLVSSAQALVYFTEYEGFGLPPIEAIAAGTAPVYSAIPATNEVMEGAGYPFDLASYESFAEALNGALWTTDAQIKAWADSLLRRHHWDAVTSRVIDALLQPVIRRRRVG